MFVNHCHQHPERTDWLYNEWDSVQLTATLNRWLNRVLQYLRTPQKSLLETQRKDVVLKCFLWGPLTRQSITALMGGKWASVATSAIHNNPCKSEPWKPIPNAEPECTEVYQQWHLFIHGLFNVPFFQLLILYSVEWQDD